MSVDTTTAQEPSRAEVDGWPAPAVLEFGTSWCGFCRAAQPVIGEALAAYPDVQHVKVEDGKGKPLGRSFAVKLWPTLVFMHQGKQVAKLVRPQSADEIKQALALLTARPQA